MHRSKRPAQPGCSSKIVLQKLARKLQGSRHRAPHRLQHMPINVQLAPRQLVQPVLQPERYKRSKILTNERAVGVLAGIEGVANISFPGLGILCNLKVLLCGTKLAFQHCTQPDAESGASAS